MAVVAIAVVMIVVIVGVVLLSNSSVTVALSCVGVHSHNPFKHAMKLHGIHEGLIE